MFSSRNIVSIPALRHSWSTDIAVCGQSGRHLTSVSSNSTILPDMSLQDIGKSPMHETVVDEPSMLKMLSSDSLMLMRSFLNG